MANRYLARFIQSNNKTIIMEELLIRILPPLYRTKTSWPMVMDNQLLVEVSEIWWEQQMRPGRISISRTFIARSSSKCREPKRSCEKLSFFLTRGSRNTWWMTTLNLALEDMQTDMLAMAEITMVPKAILIIEDRMFTNQISFIYSPRKR